MKLSDVMSAANLASYAEVALIIFFAAFALIVVFVIRGRVEWKRARELPLHDAEPRQESHEESSDG